MKKQTLTRKELYDLVWSTPIGILAEKYSMSNKELKKLCSDMEIPIPQSGHWVKLKFKKPVEIINLPENLAEEKEITVFLKEDGDQIANDVASPLTNFEQEIMLKEGSKLNVPKRLLNPHVLTIKAKESFKKNYRSRNSDLMFCTQTPQININVTQKKINRALLFIDAFVKVMENRGHIFKSDYHYNYTFIEIQNEKIEFQLAEKLKQEPAKSDKSLYKFDYVPTGIFVFAANGIFHKLECRDGKLPLEKQIATIVSKLEIIGDKLKQERIHYDIWNQQYMEKIRIEEENKKHKEKELDDFKILLRSVGRWHVVEDLRNYINLVEENAKTNNTYSEDLKTWVKWAREKANWYDPLINSEDEFLTEKDKENLLSQKEHVGWGQ